MADSGVQSPLGINVLGSVLNNTGIHINSVATSYMGSSKTNSNYAFGSLTYDTVLRLLTWAINDGYNRGPGNGNATLTDATYNNLISIGKGTIPALGNSIPPTYLAEDPAGVWTTTAQAIATQQSVVPAMPAPATSGYPISYDNVDQGQDASWLPYDTTNPNKSITQWGFARLPALQAWNEFNWNGTVVDQSTPEYKEFCSSFISYNAVASSSNKAIISIDNSDTFMQGTYSNMNDLVSADITGVSLSTTDFGNDLISQGKIINLKNIETFGLPSNLLATLGQNYAMTEDLILALLSAGLSRSDITSISTGTASNVATITEQQIYGAFLIIIGENLTNILAILQCNLPNINTLADLLNLRLLFPTSYSSLTVPIYNANPGPTNSKTYYLIYQDGGVNKSLSAPAIQSYVGTIIPSGTPPIRDTALDPQNYSELPIGFDSYLLGILPNDQAVAAGAFSYTMQQIKNIKNVDILKLAKVAQGIETMLDLPLVAGTDKPTAQSATDYSKQVCSLGSGPAGSYTMSDFFGCMSGLPYPWQLTQTRMSQLQTDNLYKIYSQLFLAVTWEPATVSVQYTTYDIGLTTYYHITGITLVDRGGGYGRGGAGPPAITLSNGGSATAIIGTDDNEAASYSYLNGWNYGRVTSITLDDPGIDATSPPTVMIQCPPTSNGGGTNTAPATTGWQSPMNGVVQYYIDQANAEIASIQANNPDISLHLNTYWNIFGDQLAREQRARYTNLPPVAVPKDYFSNQYPAALSNFVNSIPTFAMDTRPHMAVQTLEAISDLSTLGGQSLVAMMRQERNQSRLSNLGIDPDNNISDQLTPAQVKTVTTNGTIDGATAGIPSCGNDYTFPAWPGNDQNGNLVTPVPMGIYDSSVGFQPIPTNTAGDITQILDCNPNPVANPIVPAGPVTSGPTSSIVIIAPPAEYDPTNLPPNLDPNFISSTLLPASPNVATAIDHVVTCNCDCWVQ